MIFTLLHTYIHTYKMQCNANANLAATEWSRSPGRASCRISRHYILGACMCKQTPGNWQEDQLPSHSKRCGHPKSHLDHCCWVKRSCDLHPSLRQVPIHSWVDWCMGVVGGRGRRLDNIHLRVVGLEPMTHGSGAQCTNHFTNQTRTYTYINTYIHTYIYIIHTYIHTLLGVIAYTNSPMAEGNRWVTFLLVEVNISLRQMLRTKVALDDEMKRN